MDLRQLRTRGLNPESDFRSKATFGVALAALCLLFPICVLDYYEGKLLTASGSLGILVLLATNALLVKRGVCHQTLTLFVLVPAGMLFMTTVFLDNGYIGSLWCYPSIVACYCMLSEKRARLANLWILSFALPMAYHTMPLAYFWRIAATLLAISMFSAILVRVIDKLNRQLQKQLIHDPLTGLHNRLTLKDSLEASIAAFDERQMQSSLLAIDIDHFKQINDTHGHEMGDHVLEHIAQIFSNSLRLNDKAFRTGGEEFLILLDGSDEKAANLIGERLRCEVERASILPDEAVTVSIGTTQYQHGESWTQWVKRADELLYVAKRKGRNRVAVGTPVARTPVSSPSVRLVSIGA